MKTNPFAPILAVAVALFLVMAGCNAPASKAPATPDELSQMNRDFAKALNARDAAAAAKCYTENATLLPPGEPLVTGQAAIQKYWQGFLDAGYVDGSVSTIMTGSDGNVGYEIGTADLRMKVPDGKIITEKVRYTELLKRNADGKWMSTHGMWQPVAAPAAGQ